MLDAVHVHWLRGQLPRLVAEGVVSPETAERIREHYRPLAAEDESTDRTSFVLVLFAILGAALIGGGVILILAHNWDHLGHPARAVLSFAPLVLGLALAAWVVARDRGTAWREGAGVLWTLSIGASISLVSQTYNIPGDWATFLRTWLLLAVPVLYLSGAISVFVLLCLGLVTFAFSVSYAAGEPLLFWPLAALAAPFAVSRLRARPEAASGLVIAWAGALTLALGIVPSTEALGHGPQTPLLASLFLALWGGGAFARSARWALALRLLGPLGFVGSAYVLSFLGHWQSWSTSRGLASPSLEAALAWTVAVLVVVAAVILLGTAWKRHRTTDIVLAGAGLPVVWIAFGLYEGLRSDHGATLLINLYLLALGGGLVVQGLRRQGLAQANLGMAVLSVLVLLRFFDTDWDYLVRGGAFLAVGLAFLLVNRALLDRRRKATS